jgi:hypothetical protein
MRTPITPTVTARWKRKDIGELHVYVATCGNCPGALGGLCREPDLIQIKEQATEALDDINERRDRGEALSGEEYALLGHLSEEQRFAQRLLSDPLALRALGGLFGTEERWSMSLALSHQGCDGVYYGFADSGYRISLSGKKRNRSGQRVGRRPDHPPRDVPVTLGPKNADPFDEDPARVVSGQRPVPPCRIWCPVCKRLNEVPLPRGFRRHQDGGIEECPDG